MAKDGENGPVTHLAHVDRGIRLGNAQPQTSNSHVARGARLDESVQSGAASRVATAAARPVVNPSGSALPSQTGLVRANEARTPISSRAASDSSAFSIDGQRRGDHQPSHPLAGAPFPAFRRGSFGKLHHALSRRFSV